MRLLATYLWKEWRDQRVQIVGFALLVPFLVAVAMLSVAGPWSAMDATPTFVAIGGFLIGALSLASDLVPGELRRSQLGFLARLPGDLRAPFVAKLVFGGVALAGFCLYAWFWATALSATLAGGKWFVPFEWRFLWPVVTAHQQRWISWSLLDLMVVLAAWIFAVSCWLPRGTLALPAALLVLSLIGGPMVLIVLQHPSLQMHMQELTALRIWLPATALTAGALSFLRGARHGRAPLRVAGWTLVGTLLAATPVWAWTANRWHDYVSLDLESDSFALEPVALGDGGRFVFANARPHVTRYGGAVEDEAIHPVVIDLQHGTARETGAPDTFFYLPSRRPLIGTTPLALIIGDGDAREVRFGSGEPFEYSDVFDGRTGQPMSGEQWKTRLQRGGSLVDPIVRARDFVVLPDGTRCWMSGRTLHIENADGTAITHEFQQTAADREWRPCGAGFDDGWRDGFIDLARRGFVAGSTMRAITSRSLDGSEGAYVGGVVAIRSGPWLLHVWKTSRSPRLEFVLWSPGDPAVRAAVGFHHDEGVLAALADGRVLVASGRSSQPDPSGCVELALLDPETGARTTIVRPDGPAPIAATFRGRLPSGASVVSLQWPREGIEWPTRFARIGADGSMQMTAALTSALDIVGCPDEATIVLLEPGREGCRILRARFDGSPHEVVFPRHETHR